VYISNDINARKQAHNNNAGQERAGKCTESIFINTHFVGFQMFCTEIFGNFSGFRYTFDMNTNGQMSERHRQVLGLEGLRRKRGYREGWLYHICLQKGLLIELEELQAAGLVGDVAGFGNAAGSDEVDAQGEAPVGSRRSPTTLLTVELVPSSCWFSNLRSELSKEEWDGLRRPVFERAGNRCEVCGGRGAQHPVECHEVWEYDDQTHVQRLVGLVALCPACHEAKHMGHASSVGRAGQARAHLARVNGWSVDDVEVYLEMQFEQWSRRSQHEWSLDLSWLRQFGIDISPEPGEDRRER
jgi:hypothetical protein